MPWREVSVVDSREELVKLAGEGAVGMRELRRRHGVSPTTAYKWRGRYLSSGRAGLAYRSRRPHGSPGRTPAALEVRIVALRDAHPAWGGRKLRHRLLALGVEGVPGASTITAVLRRHGRLDAEEAARRRAFVRLEQAAPNELWQMDFKGHFAVAAGGRCHPLTVLDDH